MRFLRCALQSDAPPVYGRLNQDRVEVLARAPFDGLELTGTVVPLEQVTLLAPVVASKIIGVGRNYREHAKEHASPVPERPLLFLKPPSAVIGPQAPIRLPDASQQVEHEGELAVVIGSLCHRVSEADAARHILGYTAANDVTARDLQRIDDQWTRGKGFDTFCPLGPWIDTELDPLRTEVRCLLNGALRQRGCPAEMAFSIPLLVSYISAVMTLNPGDVILTGTPAGVSRLAAGDRVVVEIDGIGALENPVTAA